MAAALAGEAAEAGKRVLAVDAAGTADLGRVVERAGLTGRFEVLRLTTRSALDDYLKIHLHLPLAPSRLGPLARIFDYVAAAAPGVRELLIIGKIGWEVRHGPWDEVIVDAPATGHVVELLTAPEAMATVVPGGPLAAQTGWLTEVLAAPTTGVVLVTLPEELPVTETGELLERLRTETGTATAGLVVNRAPATLTAAGLAEAGRLIADGVPGAGGPGAGLRPSRRGRGPGPAGRRAGVADGHRAGAPRPSGRRRPGRPGPRPGTPFPVVGSGGAAPGTSR